MHHTTIRAAIHTDSSGSQIEIPVILTHKGPLIPLVEFLLERCSSQSFSAQQKLVQAVGLLLDYMAANHTNFDEPKKLFSAFVQRLSSGTIGEDGLDPSGLYWLPRSSQVVKLLANCLSQFSDWMAEKLGTRPLNPWREASRYEEMLNWAAYHQKHHRAFLGHTWDNTRASTAAKRAKNTLLNRGPVVDHEGVKRFPEDRFADLLFEGFVVPRKHASPLIEERLNLRDVLITILMHFGGVRVSETFHLYVHDVCEDPQRPGTALVRIFHPSAGLAPNDWLGVDGKPIRCNRAAYLLGKYGMRPRTNYHKSDQLHAGWKGSLLDGREAFMHIHWFPSWAGRMFLSLWNRYLLQRALIGGHHPFAFVTQKGRPYSPNSYKDAHARAVTRIGLTPAKMLGTTPHGHRHAYGQNMADANIDPVFRRKALHHKSIESQLVYTAPQIAKVTQILDSATRSLAEEGSVPVPNLGRYGLEPLDPLG